MFAMRLTAIHPPLQWRDLPTPLPGGVELRVKFLTCGFGHTTLN